MADYGKVKTGKLKLKGVKDINPGHKKKKRKLKETDVDEGVGGSKESPPDNGGWWCIDGETKLKGGPIAIETYPNVYISALDNGKFTVGVPHSTQEGPSPEEILTLIKTPDSNIVSFKSGYGKYLGVNTDGCVVATAEAISNKEKWEFVFENGKTAIQSQSNSCFLGVETDKEGYVYASSLMARDKEVVKVRTNMEREKAVDFTPSEDKKNSKDCEIAYVKKFQHSKIDLNPGDRVAIRNAKEVGNLHEVLLDRRKKMKSDKYC